MTGTARAAGGFLPDVRPALRIDLRSRDPTAPVLCLSLMPMPTALRLLNDALPRPLQSPLPPAAHGGAPTAMTAEQRARFGGAAISGPLLLLSVEGAGVHTVHIQSSSQRTAGQSSAFDGGTGGNSAGAPTRPVYHTVHGDSASSAAATAAAGSSLRGSLASFLAPSSRPGSGSGRVDAAVQSAPQRGGASPSHAPPARRWISSAHEPAPAAIVAINEAAALPASAVVAGASAAPVPVVLVPDLSSSSSHPPLPPQPSPPVNGRDVTGDSGGGLLGSVAGWMRHHHHHAPSIDRLPRQLPTDMPLAQSNLLPSVAQTGRADADAAPLAAVELWPADSVEFSLPFTLPPLCLAAHPLSPLYARAGPEGTLALCTVTLEPMLRQPPPASAFGGSGVLTSSSELQRAPQPPLRWHQYVHRLHSVLGYAPLPGSHREQWRRRRRWRRR
jgi:hypothetical protein